MNDTNCKCCGFLNSTIAKMSNDMNERKAKDFIKNVLGYDDRSYASYKGMCIKFLQNHHPEYKEIYDKYLALL